MNTPPIPTQDALGKLLDALPEAKRARVLKTAEALAKHQGAPAMKLATNGGALQIDFASDRPEVAILGQMADLCTADRDFYAGVICQIANLGAQGRGTDSTNANFVFAVARSVQPRDELEALLATQMGAIHAATMMMARKLNLVTTIPQQDSAERALNKLARTFAMQMEALKRYRTGGQQKVTVEHVTVNAGGQAIVGAVEAGGGGRG